MRTRSKRLRARKLALEIVAKVVEHVGEEYVVLLPETIPFLSELLEDVDEDVVRRTQALVKRLEELSGEDLSQYL